MLFGQSRISYIEQLVEDEFEHLENYLESFEDLTKAEKRRLKEKPPNITNHKDIDEVYQMYLEALEDQHFLTISRYENVYLRIPAETCHPFR